MSDHGTSARLDVHPHTPSGLFRFIPLFLFIVILFVLGHWTFSDPRHVLFTLGSYSLSWIEVLLLISTVVALVGALLLSLLLPGFGNRGREYRRYAQRDEHRQRERERSRKV